jgi:hypothetical protein
MRTRSTSWRARNLVLPPASDASPPFQLPAVAGTHLDICVTFLPPRGAPVAAAPAGGDSSGSGAWPGAASAAATVTGPAAGLILKSWRPGGAGAAAVVFDWATRRLEVHFDEVRGWRHG